MTTIFDKPLIGYRFVDVRFGDSLQSIAARELNDAGRWAEIAAYNNLRPPYISDIPVEPGTGVLTAGSQLLVPAPNPVISTALDPDRVFEIDIELRNGALSVSDGDFAVVSGRDNLRQALKHRVETERSELSFHTEYGSFVRRLIGAVNGPTSSLLAAEYVKSAVLADPRVSSVSKAEAEVVGDRIATSVEVQPIVGRPVQIDAAP